MLLLWQESQALEIRRIFRGSVVISEGWFGGRGSLGSGGPGGSCRSKVNWSISKTLETEVPSLQRTFEGRFPVVPREIGDIRGAS